MYIAYGSLARYFDMPLTSPDFPPTILVVYILVAVMHIISGLSLRDCNQLLFTQRFLIDLMIEKFCAAKGRDKYLAKFVPKDARTVVHRLALKPSYKTFICCPECSACYLDDDRPDSYPELCSSKHGSSQKICGRPLQKTRNIRSRQHDIPVRRFFYHDFKEWLGEMLCRPGMEDMMDRRFTQSSDGIMRDIWDAPGLYEIPGPDGHPFICESRGGNEGRYLFSFNMDGFNPFQLKQAGRSASVMGLYMVCLNLPPEERFRPENTFLAGIIPGPKEPSMQEINHFLRPLVDDLLDSYVNGVHYMRTWKHPNGRNTRSALALIVCDLPAGRQALGFTGPQSANFCSYCKLQLKKINDLDVRSWEPRSGEEHRKLAFEWRDTPSDKRRAEITSKHGVRYSEFLRLPYLDPIRVLSVDTMHAFFLRILPRHCQEIWGMDSKIEDGDGLACDPVPSEIRSSPYFEQAFLALRTESLEALKSHKTGTLRYLAADQSISAKGKSHEQLMAAFTKHVSSSILLCLMTPTVDGTIHSDAAKDGLIATII
jgi:hypothetical protein